MAGSADVSVVIPAYNAERFIADAIESVLAQTVPPTDIVVVDDGSTDATADVAARFPLVTVLRGENRGIGVAWNRGVDAARGEYLAFIDADDLWTPVKLERQLSRIAEPGAAELVFGWMENFISPGCEDALAPRLDWSPGPMAGYLAGTLLLRRSDFLRVGPFVESWRLGHFMDWCGRAEHMGMRRDLIPDVVLRRRLHGDNIGLRSPEARAGYVRAAKAAIDRHRARQ